MTVVGHPPRLSMTLAQPCLFCFEGAVVDVGLCECLKNLRSAFLESGIGSVPRRRESSVEEDSTRRVCVIPEVHQILVRHHASGSAVSRSRGRGTWHSRPWPSSKLSPSAVDRGSPFRSQNLLESEPVSRRLSGCFSLHPRLGARTHWMAFVPVFAFVLGLQGRP